MIVLQSELDVINYDIWASFGYGGLLLKEENGLMLLYKREEMTPRLSVYNEAIPCDRSGNIYRINLDEILYYFQTSRLSTW